jgi:hypothetical protein
MASPSSTPERKLQEFKELKEGESETFDHRLGVFYTDFRDTPVDAVIAVFFRMKRDIPLVWKKDETISITHVFGNVYTFQGQLQTLKKLAVSSLVSDVTVR